MIVDLPVRLPLSTEQPHGVRLPPTELQFIRETSVGPLARVLPVAADVALRMLEERRERLVMTICEKTGDFGAIVHPWSPEGDQPRIYGPECALTTPARRNLFMSFMLKERIRQATSLSYGLAMVVMYRYLQQSQVYIHLPRDQEIISVHRPGQKEQHVGLFS